MSKDRESYVSEALTVLVAVLIVTCFVGGFVLSRTVKEVAYVSAQALLPMRPHFEKAVIVYRPLTPSERVWYGHALLKASEPAKPESVWADAAHHDG